MKKILVILLLGLGFLSDANAQVPWSVSGVKTRFTKGLGIPVADTTSGGSADTSMIVLRPQDGTLYYKRLGAWQAASSSTFYVPYSGATTNVDLGVYRLTARSLKTDSIYSNGSGGAVAVTNSGTRSFSWGAGGSSEVTFYGFAGYDANRSSTYTVRSFTDKRYVDSSLVLRLLIGDTASMLSNYRRKTTLIENADLRNSAITINGTSTALGGSISVGTVTSVAASAGTGISVSGSPITSNGTLTITNTAPDQTVTLTAGTGISVSGTYPNFTVTNTSPSSGGTVTSVSAGTGMSFTTITSTGAVNADTTVLATRAYAAGLDVAKANTSLNNVNGVLSSTYGGAGSVSGILKANGSGVVSAAVAGTDYVAGSSISGTTNYIPKFTGSGSIGNSRVVDNFGIGLFSGDAIWFDQATGNGRQWGLYYDGSVLKTRIANSDALGFSIASSGQMTLSSQLNGTSLSMSGGVVIGGTVASNVGLTIYGSNAATIYQTPNTGTGAANGFYVGHTGDISYVWNYNNYPTVFATNNTERMRITSGGDVLINTTTTDGTNKLIVNGGVKAVGNISFDGQIVANNASPRLVIGSTDFAINNNANTANLLLINNSTGAAAFSNSLRATSIGVGIASSGVEGSITFNENGVRSWGITPSSGTLNFTSGDNLGVFNFTGAATFSNKVTTTSTGVDGTYADGLIIKWAGNANETNAIQTAVSSNGAQSGFRFQASNGGGSSARTTVLTLTREGATFSSSGQFGGNLFTSGVNNKVYALDGSIQTKVQSQTAGATQGVVGTESNHDLAIVTNNVTRLGITAAGAATFSSSVTATTYTGATTTVSSSTTIADGIETVFVNNTGATTITVTLPSASGKTGRTLKVVRTAGGLTSNVNVTSVNGGTHTLRCLDAIELVSDGASWRVVAKYLSTECT